MLQNGGARIYAMRVLFSQKVNGRYHPCYKHDFKNRLFDKFTSIPIWLSDEPGYLKKI